ncbi:MAG: helix-hairpin-helix domain-containing protein [Bacteroidetes bacterium]|nr:helix-hairpin-helix domain-containing protein [Bacteroidota bacterium]MDA1268038.1 helix-hairpin-helix domain-containing protein [Bacteroidota bacterium]
MWQQVIFWCKTHFGFSAKESRGFLLLIPFLLALVAASQVLAWAKNQKASAIYRQYLHEVDSLEEAGVQLLVSPLPTFNVQDTITRFHSTKVSERIHRLPFSKTDSVLLQIVPGIGALTAGRIIKHREKLGGFIQVAQLNEVYGLKPEVIPLIWDYFDFDTAPIRKLSINLATVEELASHPYISYQEAKVIVAYRLQHGEYHESTDLLGIKIFKVDWIEKIDPYLSFNPIEKR